MWKYCTGEECKKFLFSLNLINGDLSEEKKLKTLYAISNNSQAHYDIKLINKKDGSKRKLYAPRPLIKSIQRNILHNILDQLPVSKYAMAYRKNINLVDNVKPHIKKNKILKLDITNFFENITFEMVYKYAFPTIYFPPAVGTLLTHICCYQNFVPQGAPTSSAISNLVMKPFDDYIGNWCEKQKITYTRYCDDLTFSGNFDFKELINKVESFLNVMGFELNQRKTKLLYPHNRQTVTGIVVNEKTQVIKNYRQKVRQEVYYIKKYGINSHLKKLNLKADENRYLLSILGKINFILQVKPQDKNFIKLKNDITKIIKEK